MGLEVIILSEVSQTEKEKYCMTSPYMWNLKRNDTNALTKQKETRRLKRTNLRWPGERLGEGIVRECGMDMYTLLYLKWITNKDLL